MSRFFGFVLSFALTVAAVGAAAQGQAPTPAPPAGNQAVPQPGVPPELPGLGQPHVSLKELAARVFRIPKKSAVVISPDRIRATGIMNTEFSLVGEEGDFYLVKELPPEDPKSALHRAWVIEQTREARGLAREEFMADKYIINDMPDIYPPFTDKLVFERRDEACRRAVVGRCRSTSPT